MQSEKLCGIIFKATFKGTGENVALWIPTLRGGFYSLSLCFFCSFSYRFYPCLTAFSPYAYFRSHFVFNFFTLVAASVPSFFFPPCVSLSLSSIFLFYRKKRVKKKKPYAHARSNTLCVSSFSFFFSPSNKDVANFISAFAGCHIWREGGKKISKV